jgi:hypothetical protein
MLGSRPDAAISLATGLLVTTAMAHLLLVYETSPLRLDDEVTFIAQAWGRERGDRTWEGWLEFVSGRGAAVLRSPRETTQPNLAALEYWASGLTPVYLAGALERALTPLPGAGPMAETVAVEGAAMDDMTEPRPVLNPFSVYARGEGLLRRQLGALSPRHLRAIATGYDLADPNSIDLEALTTLELIELITTAVRARLAA